MENNELKTNLETYQAQLKQVEAALMIDEDNEELLKLKTDLLEVIELTLDLLSINAPNSNKKKATSTTTEKDNESLKTQGPDSSETSSKPKESILDANSTTTARDDTLKRPADDDDDDIDFEAMFNLPKRPAVSVAQSYPEEIPNQIDSETKPKDKNVKLTREEQEKRREQRKKKLLKKQQRLKEVEEQREREKNKWQDFVKAPSKGKGKLKGLMKKSIFSSPDTSIGKVGVGTCGIGGRGMTNFENPTQYIYKK